MKADGTWIISCETLPTITNNQYGLSPEKLHWVSDSIIRVANNDIEKWK